MQTMRGVVKWFDARKGYGFILNPEGGQDIFVHYTQIRQESGFRLLRTGQQVEFEMLSSGRGMHAHEVCVVADRPGGRPARAEERQPVRASAAPWSRNVS